MNLTKFVDYCYDFYGHGGIYPMNVTELDLYAATARLLVEYNAKTGQWAGQEFVGDSIDRERVRDILTDHMGHKFPEVA